MDFTLHSGKLSSKQHDGLAVLGLTQPFFRSLQTELLRAPAQDLFSLLQPVLNAVRLSCCESHGLWPGWITPTFFHGIPSVISRDTGELLGDDCTTQNLHKLLGIPILILDSDDRIGWSPRHRGFFPMCSLGRTIKYPIGEKIGTLLLFLHYIIIAYYYYNDFD